MTTLNAAISAIADQSANRFFNITRAYSFAVAARAEGFDTVEVFAAIAAAAKAEIAAATIVVANAEMYEVGCAEAAAEKIAELQRVLAGIAKLQTIAPAAEVPTHAVAVLTEQIAAAEAAIIETEKKLVGDAVQMIEDARQALNAAKALFASDLRDRKSVV